MKIKDVLEVSKKRVNRIKKESDELISDEWKCQGYSEDWN